MTTQHVVDRFYAALSAGDLDAAVACFQPTAIIWHNFDAVPMDMAQSRAGWIGLFNTTKVRRVDDVRRYDTEAGSVQQHMFVMQGNDGAWTSLPCCLVVRIENGLIARLDEYLDTVARFPVVDGLPVSTPGF